MAYFHRLMRYRGKNRGAWAEEATGQTGTWVFTNQAIEGMIDFPEVEFVWAKIAVIYINSYYPPPDVIMAQNAEMLSVLDSNGWSRNLRTIASDFNANWGSRVNNTRGRIVTETFANLNRIYFSNDSLRLNSGFGVIC